MAVGKIAKIITVSTAVGAITIAGVAYNSNKEAILEQINQLKKKATDWQKQAGDNKYELQQQQEKYASIIKTLKDKLGLELEDGATVEQIASALQSYVETNSSKTDVETYNTAISSIATALGLELTDEDKDSNGMYDYTVITNELQGLDQAITDLETALKDEDVIDKTGQTVGDINGSIVDKINYLINQIQTANSDQTEILTVATEANNSIEGSNADFIKLNYALTENSAEDTYGILDILNNSNLYGPVTTPIYTRITSDHEVHIADATAYKYTTKYATTVDGLPEDSGKGTGIFEYINNAYGEPRTMYAVVVKNGSSYVRYDILNVE